MGSPDHWIIHITGAMAGPGRRPERAVPRLHLNESVRLCCADEPLKMSMVRGADASLGDYSVYLLLAAVLCDPVDRLDEGVQIQYRLYHDVLLAHSARRQRIGGFVAGRSGVNQESHARTNLVASQD